MKYTTVFMFLVLFKVINTLSGPNVCYEQDTYSVKVNGTAMEPKIKTTKVQCGVKICDINTTDHDVVVKETNKHIPKKIVKCCGGYEKHPTKDTCSPICANCVNGKCVAPGNCTCKAGYGGPSCEIECPLYLWGDQCQYDCSCPDNAICDVVTGNCTCKDGWQDSKCNITCTPGTYGANCSQKCDCLNDDTCDHVTGKCLTSNTSKNKPTTKIIPHEPPCNCKNGGVCLPSTKKCTCEPGWEGDYCEYPCKEGYFGLNCSTSCDCYNNAQCSRFSGKCVCSPGFIGYKCLDICPAGSFGQNCDNKCECQNGGTCSNVDGTCKCLKNWTGLHCQINVCAYINGNLSCIGTTTEDECRRICDVHYLEKHEDCICPNNNFICDNLKGCICKDGYIGSNCEMVLSSTLFIIIGGVTGVLIFVALVVISTLVIRSLLSRRRISHNVTMNECESSSLNYYSRGRPSHLYEEIDYGGYQTLNFWRCRNPKEGQYKPIVRTIPESRSSCSP